MTADGEREPHLLNRSRIALGRAVAAGAAAGGVVLGGDAAGLIGISIRDTTLVGGTPDVCVIESVGSAVRLKTLRAVADGEIPAPARAAACKAAEHLLAELNPA